MIWLHVLSILIGIWVTSIVWFFVTCMGFLQEEKRKENEQ